MVPFSTTSVTVTPDLESGAQFLNSGTSPRITKFWRVVNGMTVGCGLQSSTVAS